MPYILAKTHFFMEKGSCLLFRGASLGSSMSNFREMRKFREMAWVAKFRDMGG
jgi:hypothetical protein